MAGSLSRPHWTGWSAVTLQGHKKDSIVSEFAKTILSNPQIHDQVFRTLISLSEDGCEDDRSCVEECINDILTDYKRTKIVYLVDPRDREILHPEYKLRLPDVTRSEIHGGKTNRPRPKEIDTEEFAIEACHRAWGIATKLRNAKLEKPFNFMGLPGELRSMVYGYLLQGAETSISVRTFRKHIVPSSEFSMSGFVDHGPPAIMEKFSRPQYDTRSRLHWNLYYAEFGNTVHKDQPKNISTAILRVNSHIHREAEFMPYKSHTFDFGVCPTAALAFCQTLSQAAVTFIPRIRINFFHTFCSDYEHTVITDQKDFSKTCNALIKLYPNIKLSTKLTLDFDDASLDVASWPFVRTLARMKGIKSLRSEKGKKFASDFADMIRGASSVVNGHRRAVKEIE